MATIPIEIILQDAESPVDPTPTPVDPTDQGENTNITVPDTGAGTVDSNNSFNNSSAVISIVSIVIALLAIGAVITLLIRRYNKREKANIEAGNNTRQEKRAMVATSTIAVLALTVLLGQLVVAGVVNPLATNAATDDIVSDEADHIDVADKISIVVERTEDSEETITKVTNTSYVTSTADFGYKVTASMAEDATTANLYLDGDETSEYYIAPVSNEENGTLETNTWGYTLEETSEDYLLVPLADDAAVVLQGDTKVEDEEMTLYYGVNVNKELPAGKYTGEIEYGLLALEPTINDLTYMQDFSILSTSGKAAVLASMPEGEQFILKDNRDQKDYYISKLADGNVWMTQNLDFDIDSTNTYTPDNTDISVNWTPDSSTVTIRSAWIASTTAPSSYDPGDRYWSGVITTSGGGSIENRTDTVGDIHYHVGNYYNWTAAVAMNDSSAYSDGYQDANQSICPAGWRLPTYNGNKSFLNLKDKQGVTVGVDGDIQNAPTYFIYGGMVTGSGNSFSVDEFGHYYSSVVQSRDYAYEFNFSAYAAADPQAGVYRRDGYPVRCLVR